MTTATVAVKERPILFSGPMVRAILEGKKTQTRRVIGEQKRLPHLFERLKAEPRFVRFMDWRKGFGAEFVRGDMLDCQNNEMTVFYRCPYGQSSERLWVRETLKPKVESAANGEPRGVWAYYAADDSPCPGHHVITKSVPSIFMPRALSRITLEITNVRVERLQDISENDAKAEGVTPASDLSAREFLNGSPVQSAGRNRIMNAPYSLAYMRLWDSINAKRGYSWTANPFVWAITFRRL